MKEQNQKNKNSFSYDEEQNLLIINFPDKFSVLLYCYPEWVAYKKDSVNLIPVIPNIDIKRKMICNVTLENFKNKKLRRSKQKHINTDIWQYRIPFIENINEIIKQECFYYFFGTIPNEVKKVCTRFSDFHWLLVSACKNAPHFIELTYTNPAIAFMLACVKYFRKEVNIENQAEYIRNNVCKKQRYLLELLGFEPTEQLRKIFARIDPFILNTDVLLNLKNILNDIRYKKRILKILSHSHCVNAGLLEICGNPELLDILTNNFIINCISKQKNTTSEIFTRRLLTLVNMYEDLQLKMKKIENINDLDEAEDTVFYKHYIYTMYSDIMFWKPPIPGNDKIIPLTTGRDMIEWSLQQHNCLDRLIFYVMDKESYYYKIDTGNITATLEIDVRQQPYRIGCLLGKYNKECPYEIYALVYGWLNDYEDSIKKTA